jgi:inner membrane protein
MQGEEMPTIMSHAAVPVALAIGFGARRISKKLLLAGIVGSILPDIDVIGFHLGVAYGSDFAHRGFTHSLFFAACYASLGMVLARRLGATPVAAFLFLLVSTASHGVLDAFTNGGSGIAFLWPFSSERFFAPWRPIAVSPISIARFLSERGATVLSSEVLWIWLPLISVSVAVFAGRRHAAR